MVKRNPQSSSNVQVPDASGEETGAFPIVAIGASAGGLEALEQFLGQVPRSCGMAFVVVQHLDPTREGMLAELLQRASSTLKVTEATDAIRIEPGHVYVIPPNKDMSILRGTLHLFEPTKARGLRLPIDYFFRSMAEDLGQRSIGVILSGMGSDGTLGLRAIRDKAGLTLVQAPDSAKFDGMPSSAIDAGLADIVAPAGELPGKILGYLGHRLVPSAGSDPHKDSALEKIVILVRSHSGHDFSQYKKNTLYRRIERRMGIHLIARIADYVRFLSENPQEVALLFQELLIGVTSFFRDSEAWETLKTAVLPALLAARPEGKELRAWVAACSTGEEAFTLAMVFKEALESIDPPPRAHLQIYATDLDVNAIAIARRGFYPKNIAADVSAARLKRFFVAEDDRYRVAKEIREMVIFAPQNLISDPPFTKLDILCCRNLLIYLGPALQKTLVPLFHYSLNPGGILLLGSAETIGGFTEMFAPIDSQQRIYQRSLVDSRVAAPLFPAAAASAPRHGEVEQAPPSASASSLQSLADGVLLRCYSPAAVLVTDQGDILYVNGRTGAYLEAASGKANWNIYAMAREGFRLDLIGAFKRAIRNPGTVVVHAAAFEDSGNRRRIDLQVECLAEPVGLRGLVLIVFQELASTVADKRVASRRRSPRSAELEQELMRLREELQTSGEEMQSSQEELKSANEELQSTNEEFQSTNEELTTSKEEMQSLNEELQTVNAELQAKLDDLSRASNDMANLLNSTGIATVFLDNALCVRRFTNSTTRIIKLIPGDIGRPLSDIVTDLRYPELYADAQEVLGTLIFSEKEIETLDERWYTVRIMPYRTAENMIDGVVITFLDISVAKRLEAQLREVGR